MGTTLESIQVSIDGTLLVRYLKDDGTWHRTSIPPLADPKPQTDAVASHLEQMGFPLDHPEAVNLLISQAQDYVTANLEAIKKNNVERVGKINGAANSIPAVPSDSPPSPS